MYSASSSSLSSCRSLMFTPLRTPLGGPPTPADLSSTKSRTRSLPLTLARMVVSLEVELQVVSRPFSSFSASSSLLHTLFLSCCPWRPITLHADPSCHVVPTKVECGPCHSVPRGPDLLCSSAAWWLEQQRRPCRLDSATWAPMLSVWDAALPHTVLVGLFGQNRSDWSPTVS